jgi:hypothetical protein
MTHDFLSDSATYDSMTPTWRRLLYSKWLLSDSKWLLRLNSYDSMTLWRLYDSALCDSMTPMTPMTPMTLVTPKWPPMTLSDLWRWLYDSLWLLSGLYDFLWPHSKWLYDSGWLLWLMTLRLLWLYDSSDSMTRWLPVTGDSTRRTSYGLCDSGDFATLRWPADFKYSVIPHLATAWLLRLGDSKWLPMTSYDSCDSTHDSMTPMTLWLVTLWP